MQTIRIVWLVAVLLGTGVVARAAWSADDPLPPPRIVRAPAPGAPTPISSTWSSTWTPAPPPSPSWEAPAAPGNAVSRAEIPIALTPWPQPVLQRLPSAYRIDQDRYRPRGPSEVRDEWLLAQPRLTLPAVSPDPVPVNGWIVGVYVNRGSDFGWNQVGPAEAPFDRRFLVDGEHQTTAFHARYGLRPRLSLGVRIPIHWRGGGFMDSIIDKVHEWFETFGARDNGRPAFDRDRFRVEGRDGAGNAISWNDERSTGLGNVEFSAHWNIAKPRTRADWRAAVIARMTVPTGTGPFDVGGVDAGLQVAAAKQLGSRFDLYVGGGGTYFGEDTILGVDYERWRAQGFLALEYHVSPSLSLVLSTDVASRLVTNLVEYPGLQWYFHLASRWDVARRVEVEIGFTENLEDQQATVDFGGFLGLNLRL